ncbi:hypothetical protein [Oleiharenicola sp. Vm1]|uniref:hypothetical protein n=1 Tax=Oleiharenicola sp. Vm1 TaxID=3398393 RepID=UPI0039F4DB0D
MPYDHSRSAAELKQLASCAFLVCLGVAFGSVYEVSSLIPIAVAFLWFRPDRPGSAELYRSRFLWLVLLLLLLTCALAHVRLLDAAIPAAPLSTSNKSGHL